MLALAGWLGGLGGWFYPALVVPAVLLGRQVVALDISDPAQCLRMFRAMYPYPFWDTNFRVMDWSRIFGE